MEELADTLKTRSLSAALESLTEQVSIIDYFSFFWII